ncbi:protein containing Tape measure domain [Pseudovibrio sp. FO-BEG1]|uniref:tape measure protein n=1 Tax=Pseudovibrio sp. (strain FO-BEG1) TaxID=911045 RepID=UPI000238C9F7|nr:tape measure protein [Pseudovibrio sp. FO-BEG1]AEV36809.1 protein containing Tape measure domain [Pseudovibrio sp. FO-BEG1]
MRLGITAEFKDRASKKMRKLLRFNTLMAKQLKAQDKLQKGQVKSAGKQAKATQKLEKATGKTAQAAGKAARATEAIAKGSSAAATQTNRARDAMGRFVGKANEAVRKVGRLGRALDKIKSKTKQIRAGGALIKGGAGKIGRGLAVGAGLYAGASGLVGGAASATIGPAAQMENYQIQLNALEGSAEKGRRALSWVRDFAVSTPLETNEVIESYAKLKAFGIDPTNGSLQALTDTMAMNGGNGEYLQGVILAVGQAWTKGKLQGEEAMQLLERGIPVWDMLSKATGKSSAQLMKMASDGKLGRKAISKLVEMMGQRAVGASDKMSKTWDGMMSNMRQHWFDFRLLIAEAGMFDWAKEKLQGFLSKLNKMKADGSLKKWAEDISTNIIIGLENLWTFGVALWGVLKSVGGWLSYAADKLGGWNNLIAILIALPILSTLAGIVTGLVQLGMGLAVLGGGIAAIGWPILAVVAVVAILAVAAWLIYDNWDVVSKWLADTWEWLKQLAGILWDYLKKAFSWTPLGIIISNWSTIKSWLGKLWEGIKQKASATWEGLKLLFKWTPLGMIITNWGKITAWFDKFWTDLKAKISAKWAQIKATFTGWKWPKFPSLKLPSFDKIKQSFKKFFSGSWLPTTDTFSRFWDKVTGFADTGWKKLSGIFDAIGKAGETLANTVGETLKSLADMAKSVWSAVTGPEGADRFIDQLTEVAENGWSEDFVEGLALTEALQAGQMNLETYQQKLVAIASGGGKFATHAQKMVELSRQLEGHAGFTQPEQAPANLAEVEKANAAVEALQASSKAAIAQVDNMLGTVDFAYHGQRMMETIAKGMRSRAHLLVEEMRRVTQTLRDHLPSSPAKMGPLSDIHRLKFGETIARSIKPAPMVKAMREAAAATMAAATLSTATVSPSLAASAPQAIRPPTEAIQALGGSRTGGASGSGGTISVTYAPQITVGSGASITREEIEEILEDKADELVALIHRKMADDERLEF